MHLTSFRSLFRRDPVQDSSVNLFLIAGLVVLLLSLFAFSELAEDVNGSLATPASKESIVQFDYNVDNNIHATTNPALINAMLIASTAGSELLILAAIMLAIYFVWRRHWHDLVLLIVAMSGEELFNILFKLSFHRLRPSFDVPITTAAGFSFPSGHSMASMVFYGLLAYFLIRHNPIMVRRVLIFVFFLTVVIVIGYSRIYLGLHYPSDVLGGYIAGVGWLAFTISAVTVFFNWRTHRHYQTAHSKTGSDTILPASKPK